MKPYHWQVFIEVTSVDSEARCFIQLSHIIQVVERYDEKPGCCIQVPKGDIHVVESYLEVLNMIREVQS